MIQYCRYCCYLDTGNGIWCDLLEKEMSESAAKSVNRCPNFAFNPMDSFFENEKGYRPRVEKKEQCDGQLKLEV